MYITTKQAAALITQTQAKTLGITTGEILSMLNFIFNEDFLIVQIPNAIANLKTKSPTWYIKVIELVDEMLMLSLSGDNKQEWNQHKIKLQTL